VGAEGVFCEIGETIAVGVEVSGGARGGEIPLGGPVGPFGVEVAGFGEGLFDGFGPEEVEAEVEVGSGGGWGGAHEAGTETVGVAAEDFGAGDLPAGVEEDVGGSGGFEGGEVLEVHVAWLFGGDAHDDGVWEGGAELAGHGEGPCEEHDLGVREVSGVDGVADSGADAFEFDVEDDLAVVGGGGLEVFGDEGDFFAGEGWGEP